MDTVMYKGIHKTYTKLQSKRWVQHSQECGCVPVTGTVNQPTSVPSAESPRMKETAQSLLCFTFHVEQPFSPYPKLEIVH